MTDQAPVSVLLIEDNPGDVRLIREMLADKNAAIQGMPAVRIIHAGTLADGVTRLRQGGIDAVLLDLALPDGHGLHLLDTVLAVKDVSVVVLTGQYEDEDTAIEAVSRGAQEYLLKDNVDSNQLFRALRYSIERRRWMMQMAETMAREVKSLNRLATPASTSVTAQVYDHGSLREALPEPFDGAVGTYTAILDLALEQRVMKIDHEISDKLSDLAGQLSHLGARPRDIVEIHTAALKGRMKNTTPQKSHAFMEEGRLVVLELMGHLASHYRTLSMLSPSVPAAGRRHTSKESDHADTE